MAKLPQLYRRLEEFDFPKSDAGKFSPVIQLFRKRDVGKYMEDGR